MLVWLIYRTQAYYVFFCHRLTDIHYPFLCWREKPIQFFLNINLCILCLIFKFASITVMMSRRITMHDKIMAHSSRDWISMYMYNNIAPIARNMTFSVIFWVFDWLFLVWMAFLILVHTKLSKYFESNYMHLTWSTYNGWLVMNLVKAVVQSVLCAVPYIF